MPGISPTQHAENSNTRCNTTGGCPHANACERCPIACPKHEQARAALQQLIGAIEQRKVGNCRQLEQAIAEHVLPLAREVGRVLPPEHAGLTEALIDRLNHLTRSEDSAPGQAFHRLTPAEVRICHLVRADMSSKEIAAKLHLSTATVNRHRESIRRKLGLTGRAANLRRHLAEHLPQTN